MKLIRFGEPGREKPGVLLKDGSRIDASAFGSDYDEAFLGRGGLKELDSWLSKNASSAPRIAPGNESRAAKRARPFLQGNYVAGGAE
jgi:2,4-didehydro-3-deoxy-L-rhamnonate hydrolase